MDNPITSLNSCIVSSFSFKGCLLSHTLSHILSDSHDCISPECNNKQYKFQADVQTQAHPHNETTAHQSGFFEVTVSSRLKPSEDVMISSFHLKNTGPTLAPQVILWHSDSCVVSLYLTCNQVHQGDCLKINMLNVIFAK